METYEKELLLIALNNSIEAKAMTLAIKELIIDENQKTKLNELVIANTKALIAELPLEFGEEFLQHLS
jgi:hypothetical protein